MVQSLVSGYLSYRDARAERAEPDVELDVEPGAGSSGFEGQFVTSSYWVEKS